MNRMIFQFISSLNSLKKFLFFWAILQSSIVHSATNCNALGSSGSINADGCTNATWSGTLNVIVDSANSVTGTAGNAAIGTAQNRSGASALGILTNNGTISASDMPAIWLNNSQAAGIVNAGNISNSSVSNATIILTDNYFYIPFAFPILGTLQNSGTIQNAAGKAILNNGQINTLTNTGTIRGSSVDIDTSTYGRAASIGTLNNLQGAGNAYGALRYTGILPTNYNIIINSTSTYGELSASSVTGGLTFGIDSSSVLTANTYTNVLSGLTSSNITNYASIYNTWNNFNSTYKWELVSGVNSTTWNLVVDLRATNISGAGTIYQSSNLGGSVNPAFDGGTLQVSSAGNITQNFTVNNNNGVIDQNGLSSNFTGNITDASSANGKITITNTGAAGRGSVTLSGTNTYSGGTEVNAGAVLSIASSDALGSGTLALVGSATVPATLSVTATTTISNPITVTGDPVFNIAPTTTTTVSSPITGTGDVQVTGGGTLELTAVNTYSGPTTINNDGSTLSLSGSGSIANSSSLTNNGTFSIAGKTSNVTLGGSYTQGSGGTLSMNFSPTNTQKLIVNGSASLAGTLSLNASAGTYTAGRYTLLTSSGLTGTFGSFSSNLSSYTNLGFNLAYDSNDVYLVFTPNVADTQTSLQNTANALQGIYTLQNSVLANSFTYDCNVFGANNVCVSAGGRNTAVSAANGLNNTSALLIAGYRLSPNYRIGAYADQNLSVNNAGSGVMLGNNTPLIGVFGAWNERTDDLGTEVKVSAAYGQKNTTITRAVVGTSEPGSGSSQLNSQGAQVVAKYGFGVADATVVSPYAGIRYTQNNMGGYTEASSSAVTAPLTYSALNTNATTVLAGAIASYKGIPKTTLFASAGVESDTNTNNGSLNATGVSGLTPVNFNANPAKTRPTASIGGYYDIEKNQRLGITGIYRQEAYQAVQTTTVMATYTLGL